MTTAKLPRLVSLAVAATALPLGLLASTPSAIADKPSPEGARPYAATGAVARYETALGNKRRTPCYDISFYAIRGANQTPEGDKETGLGQGLTEAGFGAQNYKFALKYREKIEALPISSRPSVGWFYNTYDSVKLSQAAFDSDSYGRSVQQGREYMIDDMLAISSACPSTRIIVVGYSEGAHVAHVHTSDLTNTSTPETRQIRRQTRRVILVADPGRQVGAANVETKNWNGTPKNNGYVFQSDKPFSIGSSGLGKVISLCNDKDPICSKPDRWNVFQKFSHVKSEHSTFYKKSYVIDAVASDLYAKAR